MNLSHLDDFERAYEIGRHTHHRSRVVKFAAVVGRREYRNKTPTAEELVSVLNYLVPAAQQVEVVLLQICLLAPVTSIVTGANRHI